MYNTINQCDTICALLAPLDENGVMKTSTHAHSALIQNR